MLTMLGAVATLGNAVAAEDKRLIVGFDFETPQWLSESEIYELQENSTMLWGNEFVDVTDHAFLVQDHAMSAAEKNGFWLEPIPAAPMHQDLVNSMLPDIDSANLEEFVKTMSTTWFNRWRTTVGGIESAEWLGDRMQGLVSASGRSDVSVERFDHISFPQKSIIVRMDGMGDDSDGVVILSAHLDSTAGGADPATREAPGADDDASGIAVLVETLRVLLEHGFKPSKTILFIGFAAEEGGLVGSTDLVDRYFNQGGVPIFAQLQSEMNGHRSYGQIFILQDSSNPRYLDVNLGNFLKNAVNEYCDVGHSQASCGSCSDHVPFAMAGYRVACIAEAGPYSPVGLNPYIHNRRDTYDRLDYNQIAEFTKLGLAFCVEMSLVGA